MTLDPIVLFFLLGLFAGLSRSELRLPPAIYEFLSVLLLLTIGLKGGVELARQPFVTLLPQMLAVVAMGFLLPFIAFPLLRYLGRFKRADAASIAAHYGSVSVGTFAVAVGFLGSLGVPFEEYMALFVVMLEIPAILVGVVMAKGISRDTQWRQLGHEVFLGKSIVLLLGGLLIGWAAGPEGVKPIEGLFFDLFKGVLALFLLEMGLIAASQVGSLKRYGIFILIFGVLFPLLASVIGAALGWTLGLSVGGTMLLATLAASASYIAVPAAMRLTVPEANPTLSLSASLGVTFPFNILFGLPIYLRMAHWFHGLEGEMMHTENRKLMTIITEAVLENSLRADLEKLGAHGYTITDARGMGSRGVRDAGWDTSSNIRIEVVCTSQLAEAIAAHLKARYYDNYAMISFVSDVAVIRPEKF